MAQGGQGQHGGGENNSNKREKRARAAAAPAVRSEIHARNVKPAGGRHIVGDVPAPSEVTKRPSRRG